jgi:Ras family protein T1
LLLGDDGVGKSSLMSSYISNHFPQEVPHVLTEAVLPPETTANNTCVIIMDSSARAGDRDVLKHKIAAADCVVAVYDTSRPESLDNLSSEWLPLVCEISKDGDPKAVIVCGTKSDLMLDQDDEREKLHALLLAFPFVEMSLRCSAAKLLDVDSVFYFGEMVVTFPLGPIFDVHSHDFTPACRRALLRIFRIFDVDSDNLLSDSELSDCNFKCFDVSFNAEDLTKLKKQVSSTISDGIENNRVTFEGFLDIIKAMIDNHQFQVPWAMLMRCDFNEDLNLNVSWIIVLYFCVVPCRSFVRDVVPALY